MPKTGQRVVGVDGMKAGWIAVTLLDGRFERATGYGKLTEVLESAPDSGVIAVDMPLVLPSSGCGRPAEVEAKKIVGPRRSSVFLSFPAEILGLQTHAQAVHACRSRGWSSITAQAYGLREKILQAQDAAKDSRLIEVHPELSFWALAEEKHLAFSKKTWNGHNERRRLLKAVGIDLPDSLSGVAAKAGADDVLDAAAAAWTASRHANGQACRIPAAGEQPDGGLIWY